MRSLESALIEAGIHICDVDLTLKESWQRVPTSDHPHKRNGAVLIRADGTTCIRNWATGVRTSWNPRATTMLSTSGKRRQLAKVLRRDRERRMLQQSQAHAAATAEALRIWENAGPANADHPYVRGKKLPPLGLREVRELNGWRRRWLLAPLYRESSLTRLCNLEGISESGDKRPVKGCARRGVFGVVGGSMPRDQIILAEGWATAAALSIALDAPVIFTVGAGNLRLVVDMLRSALPGASMTLAADNDPAGLRAARDAADLAGATVLAPRFGFCSKHHSARHLKDWCDVYTHFGVQVLRERWLHG